MTNQKCQQAFHQDNPPCEYGALQCLAGKLTDDDQKGSVLNCCCCIHHHHWIQQMNSRLERGTSRDAEHASQIAHCPRLFNCS